MPRIILSDSVVNCDDSFPSFKWVLATLLLQLVGAVFTWFRLEKYERKPVAIPEIDKKKSSVYFLILYPGEPVRNLM